MDDTTKTMRARIRRHQGTSLAGALGLPALALVLGALASRLAPGAPWVGGLTLALALAAAVGIVVVGVVSARTNLRCPACDHLVSRQIARAYSGLGPAGSCPGCGTKLLG